MIGYLGLGPARRGSGWLGTVRRPAGLPMADLAVAGSLAVLTVLLVWASRSATVQAAALAQSQVSIVTALVAAACSVAAGVLGGIVHRLTNDARAAWIGAASALYGLVGIPATSIGSSFESGRAGMGAARLTTHILVVVMLLAAVRPPMRMRSWPAVPLFGLGFLGALAMASVATFAPGSAQAVTSSAALRFVVVGMWLLAGVGLAVRGLVGGSSPLSYIGFGVVVVSLAHAYRIDSEPSQPVIQPGMTFSSVRLLGVLIVLVGLIQLARKALRTVDESQTDNEEELRLVRIDLERVAERDHDLRTGLAGLAGVTHLIGSSPQPDETRTLRTAVTAELARLETMLRGMGGRPSREPDQAYPIGSVLRDLVALRRGGGMDIGCDAEPGLWARGSAAALTQVLTNVLANCARHAPGSPIRIQASRRDDRVRLRISDFGPGVPTGSERSVFGRGTRGAASLGHGLGLHNCRQLLTAQDGSIEIRPGRPDRPGCTVIIELAAAGPQPARTGSAVASKPR